MEKTLAILCGLFCLGILGCYAAELPLNEGIARMKANEDRFNSFVNESGTYTTNTSPPVTVPTIRAYMDTLAVMNLQYNTRTLLYADLAHAAGTVAMVTADSTESYKGYYIKIGASGGGSWSYLGWFPADAITLNNTTHASPVGIIYKGLDPFIHNFNYGANGTVTTTGQNTFIGINSGNLTMGATATETYHSSYNVAIGPDTLDKNTTGYSNTAIGRTVLDDNTTGYSNTGIGGYALSQNTTGDSNIGIGTNAVTNNVSGDRNIGIGVWALGSDTDTSDQVAIGYYALALNTTGAINTALGTSTLAANTSGQRNTAIGYNALTSNTTANDNTAVGAYALDTKTTGNYNDAFGSYALTAVTSGGFNVGMGSYSIGNLTTGQYNTALGYQAGRYISNKVDYNTTGTESIYIGQNSSPYANGDKNEIVIGAGATGNGTNSVTLGNDDVTKTVMKGNVGIGTTSPESLLEVHGTAVIYGLSLGYTHKSEAYTATSNDYTILVVGNTTISLPPLAGNYGRVYVIKKLDSSLTTTIIDADSTETIDGAPTVNLTTQYSFRMIQATGWGWQTISRY
jgi:hypothetical protein